MPLSLDHRKLAGFAPDLDPTTSGIILDASGFFPSVKGVRTLPTRLSVGPSLPEASQGAASLSFSDGTSVIVAGTDSTLNVQSPPGSAWITQVIGAGHSAFFWSFAVFQDLIIAANGLGPPWAATKASILTPTPWSPLGGGPPNASLVAAADYYLFLAEPNSATWWASSNPTVWNGDFTFGSVFATLEQTSGPITAMRSVRSGMVIYKKNSTFLGTFVGPSLLWTFTKVSAQVGAPCQSGVIQVQDVHYFVGPDDFYTFDGFSINRIGQPNPVREWFFDNLNVAAIQNIAGRFDEARDLVVWHYPSVGNDGHDDKYLSLNVRTQTWLPGALDIECTVDGPIPYTQGVASGVVIQGTDMIEAYGQANTVFVPRDPSFIVTGDIGDRHFMWQVSRVRPGFTIQGGQTLAPPVLNTLSTYTPAGTYTTGPPIALSADGWFNVVNTARLQRLMITAFADLEIADYELQIQQAGNV